jgi:DNA-binding transcriptional regulator YhcF (GntR family)
MFEKFFSSRKSLSFANRQHRAGQPAAKNRPNQTNMILNLKNNRSKASQLIEAITAAISGGEFKAGDALPSINKLSAEFNLARDTVYKAFKILKERGIIDSTPAKGHFVSNGTSKIFVLLDVFSSYKDDFYRELIARLPLNYRVDLYFHQFNETLFNNLILDSVGRYDLYVVTNYINDVYYEVLDRLDKTKVLLIDLGKFKKDKFSYICQGFDNTLYDCLSSGIDRISRYRELRFIFPPESEHPRSCLPFFTRFCDDHGVRHRLIRRPMRPGDLVRNTAYLVARHNDVVEFVKICRSRGWRLGEDIGLVTFNDTPMLEVIDPGISVISTDFKRMGQMAAEYIVHRQKTQTYIPTQLIRRGSL